MKKLIMVMMVIIPVMAHGATMCSKNDTITIALDPATQGTGYGNDRTYSTWWAWFPYGTIRGVSACLSSAYGKSTGGTVSQLTDTNPDTNESARVFGGETNGQYCWCKMTHPALSLWGFNYDVGSASSCSVLCAYYCGYYAQIYPGRRTALFGSVASN